VAEALDNLLAALQVQGKESAALKAALARVQTQVAGIMARTNTKG
jgi:hypothetical protein